MFKLFGFEMERVMEIMISNMVAWLALNCNEKLSKVKVIRICNNDEKIVRYF